MHTGVDERGPRDGDCSYSFVMGVSYLVYASGVGDSLSTSTCTFTSPEVAVGGVLRELRAIRDGQPVDSLFGTVTLLSPKSERWLLSLTKMRPLGDVSVRVTDGAGRVRSTKTDERGVYLFEWLPPDSYRIEEDLPAGLRALSDGVETLAVDLTDKDATRIGCRADIRASLDAQISGAVSNSQGRSAAGFAGNKPLDPKEQISATTQELHCGSSLWPEDGRNWLGARQSKLTRCSVETPTKKQKVASCNTVGYPQALSSWSNISFILFHRPARSSSNASRGIHALNSYPLVPLAQGQHW